MNKNKTIRLDIHADDALLLIGVLDHAITEGERNLEDQRTGRTTYDVGVNDTVSALVCLKSWRDALLAADPSPYGPKARAIFGPVEPATPAPALSKWTVCYTRIPTNYNSQQRLIVEAESADAARALANEHIGDRGKTSATYYIESVKPYVPVASVGRVVGAG